MGHSMNSTNRDGSPKGLGQDSTCENGDPDHHFYKHSTPWTDALPKTEHVDFFRNIDWASTLLGPLDSWGPALRLYTSLVMMESQPAVLYWGPERIAVYNEPYVDMIGQSHPKLMGDSFERIFPEVGREINALFDSACSTEKTVDIQNVELYLERRLGYKEEAYFVGHFVPVRGNTGQIEGVYHTVIESTASVLYERGRRVVDSIAAIPTNSIESTLSQIIEALQQNPRDTSMAMLYALDDSASENQNTVRLVGSLAVPDGHPCMPKEASLDSNGAGIIPVLEQVFTTGKHQTLSESDGSLQKLGNLFDGVEWCGYGEPARDIVVLPLFQGVKMMGFYVQAGNPRRPHDKTAQDNTINLARYIQAKWVAANSNEEYRAAIKARRQQEEFIDMTSHEMRNPLQAMTQLADGIVARAQGPQHTLQSCHEIIEHNLEAASTIMACATQQKRIIDDVLMLSRLRSDLLSIEPSVANPRAVLEDSIKMLQNEATINDISITGHWDVACPLPPVHLASMDASRITQVLINLIGNAIKFTSGREKREIFITYGVLDHRPSHFDTNFGTIEWIPPEKGQKRKNAAPIHPAGKKELWLYFSVQDTGRGITATEKSRLFKRFSQASSRTHITHGGSGLGLYICRELVERHGGGIGLASQPDVGSVFSFFIEARSVDVYEVSSDLPRLQGVWAPTSGPGAPKQFELRNFNILLVEDNIVNQKVLAAQLRRTGHTVTVANHGQEALNIIEKTRHPREALTPSAEDGDNMEKELSHESARNFDVILLDWEMPIMNGLECCRRIRELKWPNSSIPQYWPIIGITANVRPQQKQQALDAGMDSVLSKPFTVGELLDKMSETAQAKRQRVR